MTNRLTLLLGEFSTTEEDLGSVLAEWSAAGLLQSVGWVSLEKDHSDHVPPVKFLSDGVLVEIEFFELLTSQIWDYVSVLAVREGNLASYDSSRFAAEINILSTVRKHFDVHRKLSLQTGTVSIIETEGVVSEAFSPVWDIHLLQEPIVRIDTAVASQPIKSEHRSLLVALLAITSSGGFVWQVAPVLEGMVDPSVGNNKPVRLARSFLRVVSAGRLTDDVLSGAFPASGPWAVPPDLMNGRAVTPGTNLPESVLSALATEGRFVYGPWDAPQGERPTEMGFKEGLKLYVEEFLDALRSIPRDLVESIKGEVEDWVQRATFGADSQILLKFNPQDSDTEQDEVVSAIRQLNLGDDIDPIGDSVPWNLLQKVAFSSVDGGAFPTSVKPPMNATNRLVYTDPWAIGPSPGDSAFEISELDRNVLGLRDLQSQVGVLDVEGAHQFNIKLQNLKSAAPVAIKVETPTPVTVETPTAEEEGPVSGDEGTGLESIEPTETDEVLEASNEIDRHRPSHRDFDQTEYVALTSFYCGDRTQIEREYGDSQDRYKELSLEYPNVNGLWSLNGTCDFCGTNFDHGMLFLHTPTNSLVHVGHICAKKFLPNASSEDFISRRIFELDVRWSQWLSRRTGSLLWRVSDSLVSNLNKSRSVLSNCISILGDRPQADEASSVARKKFRKWTRRGLMIFLLLVAASVASVFFTPLPLLLLVAVLSTYFAGLALKLFLLAKALVQARHRLKLDIDRFERAYLEGRHAATEAVRLGSVREQFEDWQQIIRTVVHMPFGRDIAFGGENKAISEVRRPPAFILANSTPDEEQKMRLFLNARKQTIHSGWLQDIVDILRSEWESHYRFSRLIGPGDNILPEADNAPSGSIVGKRPLSNDDVFYPRTDFRVQVLGGTIQHNLVRQKAGLVAADMASNSLDQILGPVAVNGIGGALTGLSVHDFLSGLSQMPAEPVPFDSDVIGDSHTNFRGATPEVTLPPYGNSATRPGQIQVQPGIEMTAAAWKIELSEPISPLSAFRGFVQSGQLSREADNGLIDDDDDDDDSQVS